MRFPFNRFQPIVYQGQGRKERYFEGWYYKAVTADGRSLAFIPGISLGTDPHSFIQVIGSASCLPHVFRFPPEAFRASDSPFSVTIENNRFTKDGLQIHLRDTNCHVEGALDFTDQIPVRNNLFWPNSMGPFAWFPRMECNHGVIHLDTRVSGTVRVDRQDLPFDQDAGYLEKDWGTSFPRSYLWLQCNNFPHQNTSLMLSIARVPVGPGAFTGVLGFLQHGPNQYRFATYNGTRVHRLNIRDDQLDVTLHSPFHRLSLQASRREGGLLDAPVEGSMTVQIRETLDSTVSLRLTDRQNRVILESRGTPAGLEIVEGLHNR